MKFVLILILATVLQVTEVNGFFGWWFKRNKETAATKLKFDNLDDATRRFQVENFGVSVPVGTTYTFKIRENPTTGYTWNISEESKANFEEYFSFKKEYERANDKSCVGCTGVGGQAVFTITAVKPGKATFEVGEKRPWETTPPVDSLSIEITIV